MAAPERLQRPHLQSGIYALPLTLGALAVFDAIIDVRSPSEFSIDHIPGAINHPVLNDDERIHVGTIYKQRSAFDAKKVGASLVARNISAHLDTHFRDKPRSWKPLIYCWRGGARSGAMAHILRSIGWTALQLDGGYKSWRSHVIRDLDSLPARFQFNVICGRTGSGKSRLLEALAESGAQVLDLEKLAAHKGSVLGDLPDEPQPAQKFFESRIWEVLSRFNTLLPVFVEAESKKIGNLRVPQPLIAEMWNGACYEVVTPAALRAQLLKEEYAHLIDNRDLLFYKLDCLTALHAASQIDTWKQLAIEARWDEFVADLLLNHYDPAYKRSMFSNYLNARDAIALHTDDISPTGFARLCVTLPRD